MSNYNIVLRWAALFPPPFSSPQHHKPFCLNRPDGLLTTEHWGAPTAKHLAFKDFHMSAPELRDVCHCSHDVNKSEEEKMSQCGAACTHARSAALVSLPCPCAFISLGPFFLNGEETPDPHTLTHFPWPPPTTAPLKHWGQCLVWIFHHPVTMTSLSQFLCYCTIITADLISSSLACADVPPATSKLTPVTSLPRVTTPHPALDPVA